MGNQSESRRVTLKSIKISIPRITWDQKDIQETQGIYDSWGLSSSTLAFLKMFGLNTIEVLEKMDMDDVDKLFSYTKNCFDERIKFKVGLRKWRRDRNIPLLCDQGTPPSTRKVLELLEKIASQVIRMETQKIKNISNK